MQQAAHGYSTHVPFDLQQAMPVWVNIPFLSMLWNLLDGIPETHKVTHCSQWLGNCFPLPAFHREASVELNGGMEYWNELWPQSSTQLHISCWVWTPPILSPVWYRMNKLSSLCKVSVASYRIHGIELPVVELPAWHGGLTEPMWSNCTTFVLICTDLGTQVLTSWPTLAVLHSCMLNRLAAEFYPVEVTLSLWIP